MCMYSCACHHIKVTIVAEHMCGVPKINPSFDGLLGGLMGLSI